MLMWAVSKNLLVGFFRGWNSTIFGGDYDNPWNGNLVRNQYFTEYTKPPRSIYMDIRDSHVSEEVFLTKHSNSNLVVFWFR